MTDRDDLRDRLAELEERVIGAEPGGSFDARQGVTAPFVTYEGGATADTSPAPGDGGATFYVVEPEPDSNGGGSL